MELLFEPHAVLLVDSVAELLDIFAAFHEFIV